VRPRPQEVRHPAAIQQQTAIFLFDTSLDLLRFKRFIQAVSPVGVAA
jgi:hypothetical protein